jgi:hypothetical protein
MQLCDNVKDGTVLCQAQEVKKAILEAKRPELLTKTVDGAVEQVQGEVRSSNTKTNSEEMEVLLQLKMLQRVLPIYAGPVDVEEKDYIPTEQGRVLLTDVHKETVKTVISERLKVPYLSEAPILCDQTVFKGIIFGRYFRPFVSIPVCIVFSAPIVYKGINTYMTFLQFTLEMGLELLRVSMFIFWLTLGVLSPSLTWTHGLNLGFLINTPKRSK